MKTTLRDVLQGIPATVVGGLRLGARDALVRRVFLSAGAVGCALAALELLTPGRAAALTGASESGAVLYAVIACLGFVSSGVGSHLAPLTARLAGSGQRAVMVSLGAGASGLLLLGATAVSTAPFATVLAAGGYALVYLGIGRRRPARTSSCTAVSPAPGAPPRCPSSPWPSNSWRRSVVWSSGCFRRGHCRGYLEVPRCWRAPCCGFSGTRPRPHVRRTP